MADTNPRPPFDVEMSAVLAMLGDELESSMTIDSLDRLRLEHGSQPINEIIAGRPIERHDRVIPGPPGAPDVLVSILHRQDHEPGGPAFYFTHGGGMIMGDRFYGIEVVLDWVDEFDAVAVTVEYRLAPEHPDPALIDDCYAGLRWTAANFDELGFDPRRLVLVGGSAGGGLAAGLALTARDSDGPSLAGQVLMYPMLDDRNDTISSRQLIGEGIWDRISNETGWDALLGDRRKTGDVSIYASPARAQDLSGLPPTFIEVGSVDVFRDESVAYASKIWAGGGIAELHVWPGAIHGYDLAAPQSAISVLAKETRTRWMRRTLGM